MLVSFLPIPHCTGTGANVSEVREVSAINFEQSAICAVFYAEEIYQGIGI